MTFINIQVQNILTTNKDLTQSAHFLEKFICLYILKHLTAMPHERGAHIIMISNCMNGSFCSSGDYLINTS